MKRVNNLYPILISDENLKSAILEVNKTHRWNYGHKANETVKEIDNNLDKYIVRLRNIIINGFTPSPIKTTTRWDKNAKKFRDISEPKLWPDQYVHHAVI